MWLLDQFLSVQFSVAPEDALWRVTVSPPGS
jgi:hypothetical protein